MASGGSPVEQPLPHHSKVKGSIPSAGEWKWGWGVYYNQSWRHFCNIVLKRKTPACQLPTSMENDKWIEKGRALTEEDEAEQKSEATRVIFQNKFAALKEQLISYGSCQFPTLGFVVERYKAIESFIPENFWKIKGRFSSVLNVQKGQTCCQSCQNFAFCIQCGTNGRISVTLW